SSLVDQSIRSPDDLVQPCLLSKMSLLNSFEQLRASQGTRSIWPPRWLQRRLAIRLQCSMCATARDWYQRDKASVIRGNESLADILAIIIEEVIGARKARVFISK